MPPFLNPSMNQENGLSVPDHVIQFMFQIDQGLQAHGHPPMSSEVLQLVAKHLSHPDLAQKIQSGQLSPAYFLQEALSGLDAHRQQIASLPGADPDVIMGPTGEPQPEPGGPEPDPTQGIMSRKQVV